MKEMLKSVLGKKRALAKVGVAALLAFCLVAQMILPIMADTAQEAEAEKLYKNLVVLGDSLCLGFSAAGATETGAFDIPSNAVMNKYPHSYPSQLAGKLGLDVDYLDDGKVELYNYGVCAAWSGDMLQLLTDPFYSYVYAEAKYKAGEKMILPYTYNGQRLKVDTTAPGYDLGNPATWVYTSSDQFEDYTVPAGTEITVAYDMDYWGMSYTVPNEIIANAYTYVGINSFDEQGNLKDNNHDGKCDIYDYYFYAAYTDPMTFEQVCVATPDELEIGGRAVKNPMYFNYYYDMITDSVRNGDLVALAVGGNDIYHTMMPYQANTGTVLGDMMYMMTQLLQSGMGVGEIVDMMQGMSTEDMAMMFGTQVPDGYDSLDSFYTMPQSMDVLNSVPVHTEGLDETDEMMVGSSFAMPGNVGCVTPCNVLNNKKYGVTCKLPYQYGCGLCGAPAYAALFAPGYIVSALVEAGTSMAKAVADEIKAVVDYYSTENINAALADVIADYKVNYENLIRRVLELQDGNGELVLVGNFNPFGLQNYLNMLALDYEDGDLKDNIDSDAKAAIGLLKLMFGDQKTFAELANMTPQELCEAGIYAKSEMEKLMYVMQNNPDMSSAALTQMLMDTTYPLAVLLMGNGLKDVYADMNLFLQQMAEKYDLTYVDISNAPTSGVYDPHPTAQGHAWIAEQLYKAVVPTINAGISPCSSGKGSMTGEGKTEMRLRGSKTYRFEAAEGSVISAIYVDGKLLDRFAYSDVYSSGVYTFDDVRTSHTFYVQFDRDFCWQDTHNVDVLGSYAAENMGAGMYKLGEKVTVNAGEQPGYEFAEWLVTGTFLTDAERKNPQVSFFMPDYDVTLTAVWRPVMDEDTPVQYNTLSFDTDGGLPMGDLLLPANSELYLTAFVPVKYGYVFAGWYAEKELLNPINKVTLYTNDTVYARFVPQGTTPLDVISIRASISEAGTGSGKLTSDGVTFVRLRDSYEYRFEPLFDSYISAVFVDGVMLDPYQYASVYNDGVYVFHDNMANHSITVQFDKIVNQNVSRYNVDLLGTYETYHAGEGRYMAGTVVTVRAGERDGYVFSGWTASEGVVLADPTSDVTTFVMPDHGVTVTAAWTPVYNLYFNTNGGNYIHYLSGAKDSTVDSADFEEPVKFGLHFDGWYFDSYATEFSEPVTGLIDLPYNKTVNAKWYAILSFDTGLGSEIDPLQVDEYTMVDLSEYVPTREGYIFDGWFFDENCTIPVSKMFMWCDGIVWAKWTPEPPETGDHNQNPLWAVLMALSAVTAVGFIYLRKKTV